MENLQKGYPSCAGKCLRRLLSRTKLAFVAVMLLSMWQLSAATAYAQKNVTFQRTEMTLEQFFAEIRRQTGDIIMFSDDDIDAKTRVTVGAEKESVSSVLDRTLRSVGLGYKIVDDYVVIYKQQQPQAAAKRTVTGTIVDENGKPLPGASVLIKGTQTGVAADATGNYSITFTADNPVISASFIGYKECEEAVANRAVINFVLVPDAEIETVIVTGFFTRATESFTGSTRTITNEQLRQANPTNLLSALSIVEPSFRMMENIQDGSNPNVIPEFEMRGSSSLPGMTETYKGNPNMPVFIMDNFEVTAEKVFDLDPNRVETITLLKDAAATALYGSRASNGVVVITTKLPPSGKINLTYNVNMGFTYPDLTDYDLLNAREKVDLEIKTGYYNKTGEPYADQLVQEMYDYRMELLARGNDTYWLNKPLRNAFAHQHSLNVEGGERALRFALDMGYDYSPGVMKESDRERKSIGVTLQYNMGDKLVLRNQMTYGDVIADNSPYGSFSEYARLNPYYAIYDDNEQYLYWLDQSKSITNPLFNTMLNNIDRRRYNEWLNNFSATWWITSELNLKGTFSIMQRDDESTFFRSAKHTDFAGVSEADMDKAGIYSATDGRSFNYDASLVISYNKEINKHFINANAVLQAQESSSKGYTVNVEGFPDDNLDYIGFGLRYEEGSRPTSFDDISRLLGVLGSVNYSYDNRYLADFSIRGDASSKFGADKRWAAFWSVGVGWNIHNEKFFADNNLVNKLRFRTTYGYTGGQNFNPYQAMTMYSYNMTRRYNSGVGATMIGIGNDQLRWQQNAKFNVGIDVGLFRDRVNLSFDWYNEKTTNQLSDVTIAPSLGFNSYRENLGSVQNRGWEISSRFMVYNGKKGYVNISVGAVRNRNKLLKLSESLAAWNAEVDAKEDSDQDRTNKPRVRYMEGQSLKTIWGVRSLGINPTTGDEIFLTRDGKLTDKWESKNQVPIGVDEPDLEGNIGLNAGFYGFQLTAYFNYRIGGQTYNSTLVERVENVWNWNNTDRRVLEDRWQKPGDITYFKGLSRSTTTTQSTSRFVSDYNFLRFASLSLSYDFDSKLVKAAGMNGLRLTFSMNDIFRVSNVKEERGISYPFSRNARLSVRVVF
ncbi:SusC/RagA family TonB-linked outer membrane protein [Alistipes sp. OttesenSCG-928-B03]|nr:SusC/RagA family TonB-linked outer membrane protein [Alistipes sp. OttesenSCG-928-B03]